MSDFDDAYAIVGIITVVCLIIFAVIWFSSSCDNTNKIIERTPIYSIGDSIGVEGSFFLGTGSVDSKPVYIYYYKTPDGGYVLTHLDADYVTIYMDGGQPFLAYVDKVAPSCSGYYHWNIHVPPGTIKHNYNLDSE